MCDLRTRALVPHRGCNQAAAHGGAREHIARGDLNGRERSAPVRDSSAHFPTQVAPVESHTSVGADADAKVSPVRIVRSSSSISAISQNVTNVSLAANKGSSGQT